MDLVRSMLIGADPVKDRGVGCQVEGQISPNWNQAAEGVKPSDEELVAPENGGTI